MGVIMTFFITDNGIKVNLYNNNKTRVDPLYDDEEKKMKCVYLRHGIGSAELISWMDKNLKGFWFYFDDAIIFLTHPEKDEMLVKLVWG
jgi:hypothetical protein